MNVTGPPELVPSANCLAIAQRNQKHSPLLQLPAELRNRIYDYVLDSNSTNILHDDYHDWDRLDFSRTCRRIFSETIRHYFESKLLPLSTKEGISCPDIERLRTVIAMLTPSQKRWVNTVVLPWKVHWALRDFGEYEIFGALPNLQMVGFQCLDQYLLAFMRRTLQSFEDIWGDRVRPYTNALVKPYGPQHKSFEL